MKCLIKLILRKNDFSMKNNDKLAKDEEFSDKNSLMI